MLNMGASVPIQLDRRFGCALIDPGAEMSFVRPELALNLQFCPETRVVLANGSEDLTAANVKFKLGNQTGEYQFMLLDKLTVDCILGLDFQAAERRHYQCQREMYSPEWCQGKLQTRSV